MKYIVNDQINLSQPLEGPLAPQIPPFAEWASEQGYARYSIYRQVLLAACFSRWLDQQGIALRQVSSEHTVQYLQYRVQRRRIARGDAGALRQLIDFLRYQSVIPAEKSKQRRLTSAERCAQAFEQYLREQRALSKSTAINYLPFVRAFLTDRFGDRPVRLSHLRASDIVRFVRCQASRLHRKQAKLMTSALRSFLRYARYARYCGDITLDLAAAVPTVANWSMTSIPRAISANDVRQLLASIDRRTAMGRRDYAILLLLARLGLRASEVVLLELDDIDWNTGTVRVRGKNGFHNEFPLSSEVGEAITAYLHDGRPHSSSRRVFLCTNAPIRGLQGASSLGAIVRSWLERAGINAPTYGAHQFRHGLATELLRQGASLSEIGDVLGHRCPQTTMIYAKVDIEALRTLALPWPGGV